jgi:hypothetical protein
MGLPAPSHEQHLPSRSGVTQAGVSGCTTPCPNPGFSGGHATSGIVSGLADCQIRTVSSVYSLSTGTPDTALMEMPCRLGNSLLQRDRKLGLFRHGYIVEQDRNDRQAGGESNLYLNSNLIVGTVNASSPI